MLRISVNVFPYVKMRRSNPRTARIMMALSRSDFMVKGQNSMLIIIKCPPVAIGSEIDGPL